MTETQAGLSFYVVLTWSLQQALTSSYFKMSHDTESEAIVCSANTHVYKGSPHKWTTPLPKPSLTVSDLILLQRLRRDAGVVCNSFTTVSWSQIQSSLGSNVWGDVMGPRPPSHCLISGSLDLGCHLPPQTFYPWGCLSRDY